ncbi:Crp/Fnr family transcriptional regulator [Pseudomonas cavernicola]|uniref:Crp/Fnr family transcriptional regulator n=1 Tax=Pseudomonas cavernicola TaxID=2320866 RepID=A0A418X8B9_9PSED|nr:Crp/Fnr family transcriptional regulator [Pseudomonas cavernicola]RJG08739.1 Crp/Fnr family transcriptional regulator [Pseudomonas cavernicola]
MQLQNARLALQQQLGLQGISDEGLLSYLAKLARFHEMEKDEVIIKAGHIPTHFYVILSGMARYYYLSPNGKEWNKAFFHEGQWVGSLSSFLRRQPCSYTISALERCCLAALPVSIFEEGFEVNAQLQMLLNRYIQEIMLRNEEREALLLTCDSEARYLWLLEHQEWLVRRVPQYHLASYLGMEPASLSRIKGTLTNHRNTSFSN